MGKIQIDSELVRMAIELLSDDRSCGPFGRGAVVLMGLQGTIKHAQDAEKTPQK